MRSSVLHWFIFCDWLIVVICSYDYDSELLHTKNLVQVFLKIDVDFFLSLVTSVLGL